MTTRPRPRPHRRPQSGISMVELMVGVAVGLFVVGGAVKIAVDSLVVNRTLLLETRVNQDLRSAADLVARDLRRASYWEASMSGLWSAGLPVVSAVNPYAAISTSSGAIVYTYQRPDVDPATAPLGFRLAVDGGVGRVELQNATGGWQTITDPQSLNVTELAITPTTRTVELWRFCACRTRMPVSAACTDAALSASATRPQMLIRQYEIRIAGSSVSDAAVQRELRETVRVRNDELRNPNGCPAS